MAEINIYGKLVNVTTDGIIADYDQLDGLPIIKADFTLSDFTPTDNTYYLFTGTRGTYTKGKLYFYNGSSYEEIGAPKAEEKTYIDIVKETSTSSAYYGQYKFSNSSDVDTILNSTNPTNYILRETTTSGSSNYYSYYTVIGTTYNRKIYAVGGTDDSCVLAYDTETGYFKNIVGDGGSIDTTNLAKLDEANTFTEDNSFGNDVYVEASIVAGSGFQVGGGNNIVNITPSGQIYHQYDLGEGVEGEGYISLPHQSGAYGFNFTLATTEDMSDVAENVINLKSELDNVDHALTILNDTVVKENDDNNFTGKNEFQDDLTVNNSDGVFVIQGAPYGTYYQRNKIKIETSDGNLNINLPSKSGTLATTEDVGGKTYYKHIIELKKQYPDMEDGEATLMRWSIISSRATTIFNSFDDLWANSELLRYELCFITSSFYSEYLEISMGVYLAAYCYLFQEANNQILFLYTGDGYSGDIPRIDNYATRVGESDYWVISETVTEL